MLTLWRLEKERYADTAFRGKGSLKTSGRWPHKGTQIAVAGEHPGIAVLETLVWLGRYIVARESSAVLPLATNHLINPLPPDVHKLEQGSPFPFPGDARLFRRTKD